MTVPAEEPVSPSAEVEYQSGLKSLRLVHVYDRFADTDISVRQMVASAAILRAHRIVSLRVDAALAPLDLTMSRYELLGLLAASASGRLSFGELKQATMLHSATMTYTVDSLEKRKLIRRRPDAADRRAVVAEITAKGRELARKATAVLDEVKFGVAELDDDLARTAAVVLSEMHATLPNGGNEGRP